MRRATHEPPLERANVGATVGPRLRLIALPTEHGGWGLLLEPIALGLAVAPSQTGLFLGLAAIAGFLTRQPLKIALADRRRRVRYPRTILAERFALLHGAVALLALVLALRTAGAAATVALLAAVSLVLVQFGYDLRNQQRRLAPELTGAAALSMMAPAIALAGGWTPAPAVALWVVLMARAAPAILYVRARLRQMRGVSAPATPPLLAHAAGLVVVGALTAVHLVPWIAVPAFAVLLVRAVYGLLPGRPIVRPAVVGVQELAYGVLLIVVLAIGYLR
ncbi:MAG: YwiC-like family protein [Armatimonadota bacterium]|nr:YwiC-like family protein [Armatimonadota bacterium]